MTRLGPLGSTTRLFAGGSLMVAVLMLFAGPASAQVPPELPEVESQVDEGGVLRIDMKTGGSLRVWCSDGTVWVNGFPPEGEVDCAGIKRIVIDGSEEADEIDVSGVKRDDFPNMQEGDQEGKYAVEINAFGGADNITGSEFGDEIYAGVGDDTVYAGDGNDYLHGAADDDYLNGGAGNDVLHSGDGINTLNGGPDNDVIYANKYGNAIDGGGGDDRFYPEFDTDPPSSGTRNQPAATRAPDGEDVLVITDESGTDTLDLTYVSSAVTIDLDLIGEDQVINTSGATIRLEGRIENLVGTEFDDLVDADPLDVGRDLDGGDHETGDTLNIDAQAAAVTQTADAISVAGFTDITYARFEDVTYENATEVTAEDGGSGGGGSTGDGEAEDIVDDGDGTDAADPDDDDADGSVGGGGGGGGGGGMCGAGLIGLPLLLIALAYPLRRRGL